MSTDPERPTVHGHHRDTLAKIFEHPVSHNIEWPEVLSLLEHVGTVEQRHDGGFFVELGEEAEVFHRQHKDLSAQQVVDLRRMLSNAGYEPG